MRSSSKASCGQDDPARPVEEVGLDLRRISEESQRAASIVRNLLAFARRQTAARAPQDLTELVQRVLSLRTYELRLSSVELVTEFEPGLPPVVADGSQLQQALLNLILNAERAMRGRATKRLTVGVRLDPMAAAVELVRHRLGARDRSREPEPDLRPVLHDP